MKETEEALDAYAAEAEAVDAALRGEGPPKAPMDLFREFVAGVVEDYRKAVAGLDADHREARATVKYSVQFAIGLAAVKYGLGPDEAQAVLNEIQRGEGS